MFYSHSAPLRALEKAVPGCPRVLFQHTLQPVIEPFNSWPRFRGRGEERRGGGGCLARARRKQTGRRNRAAQDVVMLRTLSGGTDCEPRRGALISSGRGAVRAGRVQRSSETHRLPVFSRPAAEDVPGERPLNRRPSGNDTPGACAYRARCFCSVPLEHPSAVPARGAN